jgi:hypothetical protein
LQCCAYASVKPKNKGAQDRQCRHPLTA